jgi:hypothetical protein
MKRIARTVFSTMQRGGTVIGLLLNAVGAAQSADYVQSAWVWVVLGTLVLVASLGSLALSQRAEIEGLRALRPIKNQDEIIAKARLFSNAATAEVRVALRSHYLQAIAVGDTTIAERTAAITELNAAAKKEEAALEVFRQVAEANARDDDDQEHVDAYWRAVRHARLDIENFDRREQVPLEIRQRLMEAPERLTTEFIRWIRAQ